MVPTYAVFALLLTLWTAGAARLPLPPPLNCTTLGKACPTGLSNQVPADASRLHFHRCFDEGEAYSASLLITKEHFLKGTANPINLSSTHMSMEGASFMFMETRKASKFTTEKGAILQTLDLLDLSVVHLSAYERSLRSHDMSTKKCPAVERLHKLADSLQHPLVFEKSQRLRGNGSASYYDNIGSGSSGSGEKKHAISAVTVQPLNDSPFAQTLILLPWAGSEQGVGNSQLSLRQVYLRICFWSFYRHYGNNIVIGVTSQADADIVQHELQLPAKEVLVFENLATDRLPHALLREAQRRLGQGPNPHSALVKTSTSAGAAAPAPRQGLGKEPSWSTYKFVFFSESDQLLVLRSRMAGRGTKYGGKAGEVRSDELYALLQAFPRGVLTPHRLIPYAQELLKTHYGIDRASDDDVYKDFVHSAADRTSCCLPRQNCRGDRSNWLPLTPKKGSSKGANNDNDNVPFVNIHGLMVAMGNANFRRGMFRPCALYPDADNSGVCP